MRLTRRRIYTGEKKRGERGQSFAEFAISLIFLLVLVSAVIDLGWAFYTMIAMRDAAQEAAVYGSMCPNHPDLIMDRLRYSASVPLDMDDIDPANIDVCIVDPDNPPDSCDAGPVLSSPALKKGIRVEVMVEHQIRTPFLSTFIGTPTYPLRVDVTDTILRVEDEDCE